METVLDEDIVLKAEGLSFQYQDSSEGISGLYFSVRKGEIILLTGNSGCGKTTLLKCLNGLIPEITEGKISGNLSIDGKNYTSMKMHTLNEHIGSVFQNPRSQFFTDNTTAELVFPMENYGFDKGTMEQRLEELKNEFHIGNMMDRNLFSLSSGERQMIALASSVTMHQKLLLFDEPSANLDYGNAIRLGNIIKKMRDKDYTIIVADHRFYYLNGMIDRVLFMDKGKLTLFDSEESFKSGNYDTRSFDLFSIDVPFEVKGLRNEEIAVMENVSYKSILHDINLNLYKGEVTVIVGNNGVGKTTLAKLFCRSVKPDKGLVKTKDLPFFVMQDPDYQLFGTSVENELALVKDNEERINEYIDFLELKPYRHKHPFDLSGGQKQRLQIAMAMLCDRPLIIFDEPTSGLDVYSMKKVSERIKKLKVSSGVLVISHDYEFIRHVADRVVYLKDGTVEKDFILDSGTLSDLNQIFISMQEEIINEKTED